ncbi:MAG: DUF4169 family protein [Paracoccaceae bacterium]
MAKVVNLRRARKRLARDEKRAAAGSNAVKHGISRAAKDRAGAVRELDEKRLDGHRLDDGE